MKRIYVLVVAASITIIMGCANKPYRSFDIREIVRNHKIIAILPAEVTIQASKKIDAAAIKEQQDRSKYNFQKRIYTVLLQRKMRGKFFVEMQDVETTNALLKKKGYPSTPMTNEEICQVLGVDAILISNIMVPRPVSDGRIIMGMLSNTPAAYTYGNNVEGTYTIYDAKTKKVIWNYSTGVPDLITKKVPYKKYY